MKTSWVIAAVCGAFLSVPSLAWADVVRFKNGRELTCVVIKEDEKIVKVQFAGTGYLTVNRDGIAEVIRQDAATNKDLVAGWKRNHQAETTPSSDAGSPKDLTGH